MKHTFLPSLLASVMLLGSASALSVSPGLYSSAVMHGGFSGLLLAAFAFALAPLVLLIRRLLRPREPEAQPVFRWALASRAVNLRRSVPVPADRRLTRVYRRTETPAGI